MIFERRPIKEEVKRDMKLKSRLINDGEVALIWRDLRLILGLVMNRRRSRRGRI